MKNTLLKLICLSSMFIFSTSYSYSFEYPKIWNVPRYNRNFIGRDEFLDWIKQNMARDNNAILTIVGSPGIGKTQVAKKYAELNKYKYDIVWWIDADNNINDQYKMLAIAINEYQDNKNKLPIYASENILLEQVKNYLRLTKYNWLLIFDNSLNENKITNYIPIKHNTSLGNILITSKNSSTWENMMKLEKFNREESLNYLKKTFINYKESDNEILDKLSDLLGDYPLALSQAIAYINNTDTSVQEYITLFKTKRTDLWKKEKKFKDENSNLKEFDHYKNSIFTALAISITNLKKQSPTAFNFLVSCAFLDNESIPKSFLEFLSKQNKQDQLDITYDLTILKHYSILKRNYTNINPSAEDTYSIHNLIQIVTLDLLEDYEKKLYLNKVQHAMAQYLPDQIEKLAPIIETYPSLLNHGKKINMHAIKQKEINKDSIAILIRLLEYYLLVPLDYKTAKTLINEISSRIQKTKVSDLLMSQFYHIKSIYSSWCECDKDKSIAELKQSLQLLGAFPNRTEDLLNINLQLAQSYIYKCDIDSAQKYINLAENIILKNKQQSIKTGLFHAVKALYEMNVGNFETALKESRLAVQFEQQDLKIDSESPGEIPFYILESEILLKQGKYQEAFNIAQNLISKVKEIYKDEEHELASRVMLILAGASLNLGDINLAKNTIIKAIDILKNSYLEGAVVASDIDMANALIILGNTYSQEGDYMEANKNYLKAEEIFQTLYTKAKTDDISYLYLQLVLNGLNLNDSYQAEYYLKAHKEKFGDNHPRTQKIIEYLVKKDV